MYVIIDHDKYVDIDQVVDYLGKEIATNHVFIFRYGKSKINQETVETK